MLPYIEIAGTTVSVYTLLILTGFGVGFLLLALRVRKQKKSLEQALILYIFAGIGSFLGGRLFAVVQYLPMYFELSAAGQITFYEYFMQIGLVFYGGFFGCVLMLLLMCRILHDDFWEMTDLLIPILPLVQAFGRVGCFTAGCCYGIESPFGVMFNASPFAPHDVTLLPVQLFEAAGTLVLFLILYHRTKNKCAPGRTLGFYMLFYGILRFVLEFFRGDEVRGHALAFSTSQWISIGVIVLGIYLYGWYAKKHAKPAIG